MKKIIPIVLSLTLIFSPVQVAKAEGNLGPYAKQVLGISNGIIGGSILTKCSLGSAQPSLYIYMAGSLVYIGGEILAGKQKIQDNQALAQDLDTLKSEMSEGGEYQLGAMDAQVKNEESNLKFINKKRGWMIATKVIYTAAAAMAIVEQIMELPPPAGTGRTSVAACSPGPAHKPLVQALIMAYKTIQTSGGNLSATGMAAGLGTNLIAKAIEGPVKAGAEVGNAVAVPLINSAAGRIGVFSIAAGLTWIIDADLAKEQRTAESRLQTVTSARDTFKKETETQDGIQETKSKLQPGLKDSSKSKYALKDLAEGRALARSCFTKNGGNIDYSEAGCSNVLRLSRPSYNSRFHMPTLTTASNLGIDMAQAVAEGDIAKADLLAGQLGQMAARVDKAKDELLKKLNDQLIVEGKKPIDLAAAEKVLNAKFNEAMIKSGNPEFAVLTGGNRMASLGGKVGAPDSMIPKNEASSGNPSLPQESSMNFSESGEDVTIDKEKEATISDKLEAYETSENDIAKDPGVSIFKQLSNRYLLNYTKMFTRKEVSASPGESSQGQ